MTCLAASSKCISGFVATALLSFGLSSAASAQMIANPARVTPNGQTSVAGGIVLQEVDYEIKRGIDPTIKRKIIAGDFGYGITPQVDVFGQGGFIFESEFDDSDDEGDGFVFGGGARFMVHQDRPLKVIGYGLLNLTRETYDSDPKDCDVDVTDLHTGVTAVFEATPTANPYGGVDLVLHSDGDIKCGGGSYDIERDDMLNLRIGANFDFGNLYFRPEAILAGESTIILSLGKKL